MGSYKESMPSVANPILGWSHVLMMFETTGSFNEHT